MRWLEGRLSRDLTPDAIADFLAEGSRQAAELVDRAQDLTNLELDRVLYILMQASHLRSRLRRSTREIASVPVRLSCEVPGRTWKQDTETLLLSRHGALVECQHPVEVGETLLVARLDTGRQAHAKVVWRERRDGGQLEIGIEFLDSDSFWELEWDTAEPIV